MIELNLSKALKPALQIINWRAGLKKMHSMSEKEKAEYYKVTAENSLEKLREAKPVDYEFHLVRFEHYWHTGGYSLEELGTNDEELRELEVNGCKATAEFFVNQLLQNKDEVTRRVSLAKAIEYAQKGNFSLESIIRV